MKVSALALRLGYPLGLSASALALLGGYDLLRPHVSSTVASCGRRGYYIKNAALYGVALYALDNDRDKSLRSRLQPSNFARIKSRKGKSFLAEILQ